MSNPADPNGAASGDILEEVGLLTDAAIEESEPEPGALEGRGETDASESEAAGAAAATDAAKRRRYLRVSGCYESCANPWQLTLRVDVDRFRPKRMVSGDYFRSTGSTLSYFGSFKVPSLSIAASATMIRIVGMAQTTWPTKYNKIWIYIPRHVVGQPQATARVYWTTAENRRGASYVLPFKSPYFRRVILEQDYETDVSPFSAYDTGSLPSGGPDRVLTVARAFAEAGIEMVDSRATNEVPVAAGASWDNSELHTAMENHFASWKDVRQWKVWYFHANRHDYGAGLYGIMFDQKGPQRQGCASFYTGVGGTTAEKLRDQLYVGVHELGHCFNLFHSFHKSYMDPPLPNRPEALSYMNYPWGYPGGAGAFWNAFPFQFDHLETIHLRHAFYNDIVLGGNPFGKGAALDIEKEFSEARFGETGLQLHLDSPKRTLQYGEPPVVEIKLRSRDLNGRWAHQGEQLHPNFGHVQLAIERPGGDVIPLQTPIHQCAEPKLVWLNERRFVSGTSAYIGLDKNRGPQLATPGTYRIHGLYFAPDGSVVAAEPLTVRVAAPVTEEDQVVGDLLLGDEQAMLLYLLGSECKSLQDGNDALSQVLEDHSDHELAVYCRLVKGFNAARDYKIVDADGQVQVREAQLEESRTLLGSVIESSIPRAEGLDDTSLLMTMDRLAQVKEQLGDESGAEETVTQMIRLSEEREVSDDLKDKLSARERDKHARAGG